MQLTGPNLESQSVAGNDEGEAAQASTTSLRVLRRLLQYVWPQRRFLIPAVGCVLVLAAGYTAGIGSMQPFLHVLLSERGLQSRLDQSLAERRLGGVSLDAYDRGRGAASAETADHDGRAQLAADPPGRSPLIGKARRYDLIVALDGRAMSAEELYRGLAERPDGAAVRLTVVTPATGAGRDLEATARPLSAGWRLARRAVAYLPAGTTREDRMRTLYILLGVLIGLSLLQNAARFGGEYLAAVTAARAVVALRRQMYRKVLRLPLSFFARRGTSDVMSRFVQDSQDIYRGLTFIFTQSVREPLKAVGVFAFALWYAPRVTLFAALIAPLAAWLIRAFGRRVRKASRRLLRGYGRMLTALEGALVGIRVVKGYNMERFERRYLFGIDWHMLRQQLRIEMVEAVSSPLFEFLGLVAGAAAAVWFYNEMLGGRMDAPGFMIMVICLVAIFDPLRKLSNLYTRLQRAGAAAERCFEIIDQPVEEEIRRDRRPELPSLERQIEFDRVTFTYPGADRPAVRDFSLTVRRGERIAVVGPNGSGKTTLLALLMRFFEPQRGAIRLDGRDIADCSLASLRRQVSLVTQDTVLFADTVRNNIAYGDERLLRRLVMRQRHPQRRYPKLPDEDRIEQAARAAYADEFICELPAGYDTVLGEHGATLSGGQRQRVSIARAILRAAPILVFDEATSQIDSDSERKIHRALHDFLADRTGFIIAHRLSTIQHASRIVVMDAGRLIDVGRHAELLDRCPYYRSFFETQMRLEEPTVVAQDGLERFGAREAAGIPSGAGPAPVA